MQIVAVTNIKGGVGKTTTAVNVAYTASRAGLRTVLWDLDAQGAATWLLRIDPEGEVSAKRLVRGEQDLDALLEPTAYPGLEVLPADASFRDFDRYLHERKRPAERLLIDQADDQRQQDDRDAEIADQFEQPVEHVEEELLDDAEPAPIDREG